MNRKYKSIKEINEKNLIPEIMNEIMSEIENHTLIYQNEEQFQFDLALRIKKNLDENSDIEISLEHYTMDDNRFDDKSDLKKVFTDILIFDKNGNFIPIELKYKKAGMKTELFKYKKTIERTIGSDGASNLGRFDYLWDIHRIEQLNGFLAEKTKIRDNLLEKFICGYAIMITDDNKYWQKQRGCCADNMTLDKPIEEIRWCTVKRKNDKEVESANSVMNSKNKNKYFLSLIEDKKAQTKFNINKRYMPLSKKYDFGNHAENNKNVNVITINDYECFPYNSSNKEYVKNKSKIDIKAFIAKI